MASKHKRRHKLPPPQAKAAPVVPGPNEFDAGQEQAMRAGARQSRMADAGPSIDPMNGPMNAGTYPGEPV